ncbi:MAG: alpha-isopropylmalate synthase regulatory domain-containing protein, partial [Woeseia sp.]
VLNVDNASSGPWRLKNMQVTSGTDQAAVAAVDLINDNNEVLHEQASASGPVEAAFKALEQATGISLKLRNFELHSATAGDDAQGEVTVIVDYNEQSWRGHGTSVDIVEAGTRACLEVVNRILRRRELGLDTPPQTADINRASI